MAPGLDSRGSCAPGASVRALGGSAPRSPGEMGPAPGSACPARAEATTPAVIHSHPLTSPAGHAEHVRRALAHALLREVVLRRHTLHPRSLGVDRTRPGCVLREVASSWREPARPARTCRGSDLHGYHGGIRLGCWQARCPGGCIAVGQTGSERHGRSGSDRPLSAAFRRGAGSGILGRNFPVAAAAACRPSRCADLSSRPPSPSGARRRGDDSARQAVSRVGALSNVQRG